MVSDWLGDDEQLFAALRRALVEGQQVPARFVETCKAMYTLSTLDAELAALTYDSLHDAHQALPVRAETASVRAITFESGNLLIQVRLDAGSMMGQLVPPEDGEVDLLPAAMPLRTAPIDDDGVFVFRGVPAGTHRLHCRTRSGRDVATVPFTI